MQSNFSLSDSDKCLKVFTDNDTGMKTHNDADTDTAYRYQYGVSVSDKTHYLIFPQDFCVNLFTLFDQSQQGFLVQEEWISHLRNCNMTVMGSG